MNNQQPEEINEIEFDPRYSELEFILAQYDNQADPLDLQDNSEPLDWHSIQGKAQALLADGFDLRVQLWLMRANLKVDGIAGFYRAINAIDKHYADAQTLIFPQSESDQPVDSLHAAALGWLSTPACLHDVKQCQLSPGVRITPEALLSTLLQESEESRFQFAELIQTLGQAEAWFDGKGLPPFSQQLAQGVDALERIENYVNLQSADYRLDCQNLRDYLQKLLRALLTLENPAPAESQNEQQESLTVSPSDHPPGQNRPPRSRQDVILILDQALEYFRHYEPGHPAPILIRRTQKMIGMDFEKIIAELLPDAVSSLSQISGS